MSHPMRGKLDAKISIELIEADVEIGFGLVDEAKAFRACGKQEFSSRALEHAQGILADIDRRLERLGESESVPFHALVTELRNEIAGVERDNSNPEF